MHQRDKAFLGADLVNFPPLGEDYCQWLCARLGLGLDLHQVFELFKEAGSRPEMMVPVLRSLRLDPPVGGQDLNQVLALRVREKIIQWQQGFFERFCATAHVAAGTFA